MRGGNSGRIRRGYSGPAKEGAIGTPAARATQRHRASQPARNFRDVGVRATMSRYTRARSSRYAAIARFSSHVVAAAIVRRPMMPSDATPAARCRCLAAGQAPRFTAASKCARASTWRASANVSHCASRQ